MTNYSHKHVYGSGPSRDALKRQAKRAKKMTQWASKNNDKLMSPAELAAFMKK